MLVGRRLDSGLLSDAGFAFVQFVENAGKFGGVVLGVGVEHDAHDVVLGFDGKNFVGVGRVRFRAVYAVLFNNGQVFRSYFFGEFGAVNAVVLNVEGVNKAAVPEVLHNFKYWIVCVHSAKKFVVKIKLGLSFYDCPNL